MINLTNYKILKYNYEISSEKLEEIVWGNMSEEEVKWSVKITIEGINDTSEPKTKKAWDLFFLNEQLEKEIDEILNKYEVEYTKHDLTDLLLSNPKKVFTKDFIEDLNKYLNENLDVDGILDRILEVGIGNMTPFEKYFLNNHTNKDI